MKRCISGTIAITATAALAALLLTTPAQASTESAYESVTYHGPYSSQGTCEYWRNGVAAAGVPTDPRCWYDQGWYFRSW